MKNLVDVDFVSITKSSLIYPTVFPLRCSTREHPHISPKSSALVLIQPHNQLLVAVIHSRSTYAAGSHLPSSLVSTIVPGIIQVRRHSFPFCSCPFVYLEQMIIALTSGLKNK